MWGWRRGFWKSLFNYISKVQSGSIKITKEEDFKNPYDLPMSKANE